MERQILTEGTSYSEEHAHRARAAQTVITDLQQGNELLEYSCEYESAKIKITCIAFGHGAHLAMVHSN